MNDIVNIKCLRIQTEIERYKKSNIIPHALLEGAYSIEDINECLPCLAEEYHWTALKLISEYTVNMQENLADLKSALRAEYTSVTEGLETTKAEFVFPTVMSRYRPNLNPVSALYYDARELLRSYNPNCARHEWLLGLLQDREFNNKLVDALSKDSFRLDRIVSRYYWPMHKLSDGIPLEVFHARQLSKDFRHYCTVFICLLEWEPN